MISNERPSPFGNRPRRPGFKRKRAYHEDTIRSERLQIERKTFLLTLKENPRGRFLRITEDVAGRHDAIIVPATGLQEFGKLISELAVISDETPPKTEPAAE